MAKVTISFDTKEKTLEVSMDGKKMEDIWNVSFYKDYDGEEYHMALSTATKDEAEDIQTYNSVCAAEGIRVTNKNLTEQLTSKLLK